MVLTKRRGARSIHLAFSGTILEALDGVQISCCILNLGFPNTIWSFSRRRPPLTSSSRTIQPLTATLDVQWRSVPLPLARSLHHNSVTPP